MDAFNFIHFLDYQYYQLTDYKLIQLNIFSVLIFNAASALDTPLPSSSGHPSTVQTLDANVACKSFQCFGTPLRGCPSLRSETKFVSQELIAAIA